VDGRDVALIGPAASAADPAGWITYFSVTDADAAVAVAVAAGGEVVAELSDVWPGGRGATCADPAGAVFRLWQPRRRHGAQLVNAPGTWTFSHLHTGDQDSARVFYAAVFGWQYDDVPGGAGTSIRVPGYGDHLAATVDPGIYQRQAGAPPGFADVIGGMQLAAPGESAHWQVTFSVADRDAALATAQRLGATVLSSSESAWASFADIRDPQGAEFTISQFSPAAASPDRLFHYSRNGVRLWRKISAMRKNSVRIQRLNFRLAPIFRVNRGIPPPADATAAY
jgi:predicted enzyme related to lactoylglutathione lyase